MGYYAGCAFIDQWNTEKNVGPNQKHNGQRQKKKLQRVLSKSGYCRKDEDFITCIDTDIYLQKFFR